MSGTVLAGFATAATVVGLSGIQLYKLAFPDRAVLHISVSPTDNFSKLTVHMVNSGDADGIVGKQMECLSGDEHLSYEAENLTIVASKASASKEYTSTSTWVIKLLEWLEEQGTLSRSQADNFLTDQGVPGHFKCELSTRDDQGPLETSDFPENIFVIYVTAKSTIGGHFSGPIGDEIASD